jgi:hypothetical protein
MSNLKGGSESTHQLNGTKEKVHHHRQANRVQDRMPVGARCACELVHSTGADGEEVVAVRAEHEHRSQI